MPGISVIKHKDKEIIYLDGSYSTRDEVFAILEEYEKVLFKREPKSALILLNLNKAYLGIDALDKFQSRAEEHDKYFKKCAVLGVKGIPELALKSYGLFTKVRGLKFDQKFKTFNSLEKGKDWLVSD